MALTRSFTLGIAAEVAKGTKLRKRLDQNERDVFLPMFQDIDRKDINEGTSCATMVIAAPPPAAAIVAGWSNICRQDFIYRVDETWDR
jgi:hypothetical protein